MWPATAVFCFGGVTVSVGLRTRSFLVSAGLNFCFVCGPSYASSEGDECAWVCVSRGTASSLRLGASSLTRVCGRTGTSFEAPSRLLSICFNAVACTVMATGKCRVSDDHCFAGGASFNEYAILVCRLSPRPHSSCEALGPVGRCLRIHVLAMDVLGQGHRAARVPALHFHDCAPACWV